MRSKLSDILDEQLQADEIILLQKLLVKALSKAKETQNPRFWAGQEKKFLEALQSVKIDEKDEEVQKVVRRFRSNAEFSKPYFETTQSLWELAYACSHITGLKVMEG